MTKYLVTNQEGETVSVEAVDWMMAMCNAVREFDTEVSAWVCDTLSGGCAEVRDPTTGATWFVSPDSSGAGIAPSSPSVAPVLPDAPKDLVEQLFDLSMDLGVADNAEAACAVALQYALRIVESEAGSVLHGTINDPGLRFVAVGGPARDELAGKYVPFGAGIVGAAFDMGIPIRVNNVADDPRHDGSFDAMTGFQTRTVLCVPVREAMTFHGAIQLLNPTLGAFADWQVDAVNQIADHLARSLAAL